MMRLFEIPRTWKGILGVGIMSWLLVSVGMQMQSWFDGRERANLLSSCDQRVLATRNEFSNRANERDDVVKEVKDLADDIRNTTKETLVLLKKRAPVTDQIARKVQSIDDKATMAAADSKSAKIEAAKAARTAEANAPRHSTFDINKSIEDTNRKLK